MLSTKKALRHVGVLEVEARTCDGGRQREQVRILKENS